MTGQMVCKNSFLMITSIEMSDNESNTQKPIIIAKNCKLYDTSLVAIYA